MRARNSQTLDAMSHSMSPEMVPILGNDAKTQGKPNDFAKSRHDRQPSKKTTKPRRPHLVLKRAKVSGGPGMGLKRIPKRSELVFLQPSPNYCEPDLTQGSLGTQGRYCNRTSKGENETDEIYKSHRVCFLHFFFSKNSRNRAQLVLNFYRILYLQFLFSNLIALIILIVIQNYINYAIFSISCISLMRRNLFK